MGKELFPIGISARLRHGELWASIRRRGWTQKQAAEFLGMNYHTFREYINLKSVPRNLSNAQIEKLLELTGRTPDELWPTQIFSREFLKASKVAEIIREVPVAYLLASMQALQQLPPAPDKLVEDRERREAVGATLQRLPPRTRDILAQVVLEERTLGEVAEHLGLSVERVRQIVERTLEDIRFFRSRFPELYRFAREVGIEILPRSSVTPKRLLACGRRYW